MAEIRLHNLAHSYSRDPKDPADYDTDFGDTVPRWVADIAKEIAAARERSAAARQQKEASAALAEEAAVSDIDQL